VHSRGLTHYAEVMTAWAIDLDGVVWRGRESVPGSAKAVARIREMGHRLAFVTNSALRTPSQVAAKLASHGIPDAEDLVITSAMATAALIQPGDKVLVVGAGGLVEAIEHRGAELVDKAPADVVAVGITDRFDYDMLSRAMDAIGRGARFVASNDDSSFPTESGLIPGAGALVAAVQVASGVKPEIAGKPHESMRELVHRQLGQTGIMVGDRADTDGLFAQILGYDFALVLSGVVTQQDLPVEPSPTTIHADLAELVDQIVG